LYNGYVSRRRSGCKVPEKMLLVKWEIVQQSAV
jgi:hypothetical protein